MDLDAARDSRFRASECIAITVPRANAVSGRRSGPGTHVVRDRKSFARFSTDVAVRWPFLWRLVRGPLRRMFDQLAPDWGLRRAPDYLTAFHLALDELAHSPRRILDLGSGTGEPTVALARRWPSAEVIGVDMSPGMVEEARRRLPTDLRDRVRYEVADASALPFSDRRFDLVTLVNMIPFFDELARVVADGGYVLVFATQGARTPIYVSASRLRTQLRRRGFDDFAELAAGAGTSLLARKSDRT
jgi:SAM-dependent methyltransferase